MRLFLFQCVCGMTVVVRAADEAAAVEIVRTEYPGATRPVTVADAVELAAAGTPGVVHSHTE